MLTPDEAITEAQRLLDAGYPFHAHEVLESAWKNAADPERAMWKGLAQVAVGLTHLQRGNTAGAVALLRRGAEGIAPSAADAPHGLDLTRVATEATALADRVERSGIPSDPVRLQLR